MKTQIYTLAHPTTGKVHYVGQSVDPHVRLKYHARYGNLVKRWIADLRSVNLRPVIHVVDVVDIADAGSVEAAHMRLLIQQGHPLLNKISPTNISYSGMVVIEKRTGRSFESEAQAIRELGYSSVFTFRKDRHLFDYPGWQPRAWRIAAEENQA